MSSSCVRLALLLAMASLAWAPPAFGHAAFLGAQPQPGARLDASPAQVSLSFTEPLSRRLSRASLVAVDDDKSAPTTMERTGQRLVLRPQRPLRAGAYRVRWHTVSTQDGHALEGTFSFGLRAAAAGSGHLVEQSPLARSGWLRMLLRTVFYLAALLFVGALLLRVLLSREASWLVPSRLSAPDASAIADRERSIVTDVGWLAAGLAAAVTGAEAADAAGGLSAAGTRDFIAGSTAGIARALVVLLLAAGALVARRRPTTAAGLGIAAFGALAASGHAASASPRLASVLNDWLHLLTGAIWLGGMALILLVWGPTLRRQRSLARSVLARDVLPAFGRVALPAFLVVSATGLVGLFTQLGHVGALWQTAYGRVLAVKILIVGLVAALSYVHALRLRPRLLATGHPDDERLVRRHWRLLRAEPVLAIGVIAAAGALVVFPLPPRQLGEAENAVASSATCDPCPLPSPAADELAVADNAGTTVVAAWLRRGSNALRGTVRISDRRGQPSRAAFEVVGARQRACGRGCITFSGPVRDTVRVVVRERGAPVAAVLPASWRLADNGRARRVLDTAQAAMRRLRSVRQTELVSSGPGTYARTEYKLLAPDRMAFATDGGARSIAIGERKWMRWPGAATWEQTDESQGAPFATRSWFRWTPFAQHVRLLGERHHRGRLVAELALFDRGTPAWIRMTVDLRTRRVLYERSITKSHFTTETYSAFNAPITIDPPRSPHGS